MRFLVTFVLLMVFWFSLSGEFTSILIILASASSLLVARMSSDLLFDEVSDLKKIVVTVIRTITYVPWLLWQIVKSNLDVAYRVLSPSAKIDPRVVEFDSGLKSEIAIASLSNSITLTPGTVTLSATKDGKFIVHALDKEHAEGLLSGDMQERIRKIYEA